MPVALHRSMSRRLAIAGGLAALSGACDRSDREAPTTEARRWTIGYRIIMRASVGGRRREGASVCKTIYTPTPETALTQTSHFRTQSWGEAIAVDMRERGDLFGLLGNVGGVTTGHALHIWHTQMLVHLLPESLNTPEAFRSGEAFTAVSELRGAHAVDRQLWPVMAHFNNRDDITSGAFVPAPGDHYETTPGTQVRSLAAAFGRDATFDGAWIEITADPPSNRIAELLPWISRLPGADGGRSTSGGADKSFGERLVYRNLKMEGYRS